MVGVTEPQPAMSVGRAFATPSFPLMREAISRGPLQRLNISQNDSNRKNTGGLPSWQILRAERTGLCVRMRGVACGLGGGLKLEKKLKIGFDFIGFIDMLLHQ